MFSLSNGNEYSAQCVMHNTKFVQKLAFAYRNCPLSLVSAHRYALVDAAIYYGSITIAIRARFGYNTLRDAYDSYSNRARIAINVIGPLD